MVSGNRTLRKRLYGQFHRHVCSAESVWLDVFCFVLFLSTLKPDFIKKKSRFQISLEKSANTRS